jgi:chemotaxis protein MotB
MAGGGGGAWKVAYADFVTAMMALFLVLWLVSQDSKVKDAVSRTFRNPFSPIELGILRRISQDMLKTLATNPENPEDQPLRMELLTDGIRLTMFDRHQKPLFDPGSPELSEYGRWIFTTMAWQITRFTNHFTLEIEGHTEGNYQPKAGEPDAWDLSTERAHATRKLLMEHSVQSSQFRRVSGYADTAPIEGVPVTDERNRRVTLILRANDTVYKL